MKLNSRILTITFISLTLILPAVGIQTVSSQQLTISITQAIPSIPSDGKQHPAFYVTIQDTKGNPHPMPFPVNVTIASSDERILKVPTTARIEAAAFYAIINASSSTMEKKTLEVSASASGFQSSKTNAIIEPPAGRPGSLSVTLLPDVLLPQAGDKSLVIVTIVDAYGKPAKARNDVTASLSSSNLQIGDVARKAVTIPKGEYSAKTEFTATGFPGATAITASTTDLKSTSAIMNVKGPKPEKLYIWSLPTQLVNEPGIVFVGIVDASLKPVKILTPMIINLYSSDTNTLIVQASVSIPAGSWNALASLTCTGEGSAYIYASAADLVSANLKITTIYGTGEPYALKVYTMANSLPADEKNYTALVVQAVDSAGIPATMDTNKRIDIYSSNTDILETATRADMKAGRSTANITVIPKYPGTVKVSAMSSDMLTSDASATVYVPMASTTSVLTPPIPSEGEVDACLITSIAGVPVQAQNNTQILLTSSDTSVGDGNGSTLLMKKQYYSYLKISGRTPGQFFLTASGSDIPSARIQMQVLEARPSTFTLSYVKPIVNYDFPMVIQLVSALKSSAVAYEPVTVNLASSNTSNVMIPNTALISVDNTEILLYGKGLSTSKTTLTVSSEGFKSLTAQITPAPISVSIKLDSQDYYQVGESALIKASVTLEGNPVKDINVYWNGTGFKYNTTTTNANGVAENTLTVHEKENPIEAGINIGGTGYLTARKTIIGYKDLYHLEVTSNAPIHIQGSGSYIYSDKVPLSAPQTISMTGILGIMGGLYHFKQWEGASNSTDNFVVLTVTGDQTNLQIRAVYTDDYTGVMYWGIAIAAIAAAAVASIYLIRRRRSRRPSPIRAPAPRPQKREDRYPKFR